MAIVYLNGAYLPEEQALVPVSDRGFLFGDGVYEVIPAYGGHLLRLDEHLARLQHSLDGIRLANPMDQRQWQTLLEALLARNADLGDDLSVYLQVTRGAAKRDHAFPAGVPATVYASVSAITPLSAELVAGGLAAITVPDIRWQRCDIKAITLLPNVLMRQQAIDAGAADAILVRDGMVTEGAASNIFIVLQGEVITPPKGQYLLPGITRDLVLELVRVEGLPLREAFFSPEQLAQADEVWLTSSTREVVAVTQLDGKPVADGRPGPVWARIYAQYQQLKQRLRSGQHE